MKRFRSLLCLTTLLAASIPAQADPFSDLLKGRMPQLPGSGSFNLQQSLSSPAARLVQQAGQDIEAALKTGDPDDL